MFCSKCGKQIPENSAFCLSCGAPVHGGQPGGMGSDNGVNNNNGFGNNGFGNNGFGNNGFNNNGFANNGFNNSANNYNYNNGYSGNVAPVSNINKDALLKGVSIVYLLFAIFSAFISTFSVSASGESETYSLFFMLKHFGELEEVGMVQFLVVILCILSLIAAVCAGMFLYSLYVMDDNYELASTAAKLQIAIGVTSFIMSLFMESAINEDSWSKVSCGLSGWGWILLIAAVAYAFAPSVFNINQSSSSSSTSSTAMKSKVCPYCRTSYSIGNICPRCNK